MGSCKNKFFYLLNDTVHILKCIRNNWFTEETKQLEYKLPNNGGSMYVAKWSHLEELLQCDNKLVSISHLTEKSVRPKSIERQNVSGFKSIL